MTADDLINALGLPAGSRVDQRVPKKLLVEHGAPTGADKRQVNDGVEEIRWLASLKPTTIGVPEYRDATCEYLEIALLHLILRPGAKAQRLNALVHRAVPYPVWLLTEQAPRLVVSLAHKRWSRGAAGQVVLEEGYPQTTQIGADENDNHQVRPSASSADSDFLHALALARQPGSSLYALYQGWIDTLLAMQAAHITGAFSAATSPAHAATRRAAATRERQMARQIALNQQLKRAQAALLAARARL